MVVVAPGGGAGGAVWCVCVCVGGEAEGAHVGGCGVAEAHGNVVGWWGSSRLCRFG